VPEKDRDIKNNDQFMNILLYLIFMPLLAALLCFVLGRRAKWLVLLIAALELVLALINFRFGETFSPVFALRGYALSNGIFLAAALIALLVALYSFKYMEGKERLGEYYAYLLITLGSASGVLFATDYLTLLIFWGILGFMLYMLVGLGGPVASGAAKKSFMIIGGADVFMLLGVGYLWVITHTLQIGYLSLSIDSPAAAIAFICLAAAAFAKTGVMPLHSWIPSAAETAPTPVVALLPSSLDKLLGIYLLFRLCGDIFLLEPNSFFSLLLLSIGSFTIVAGVLAALVQHDLKKLLSFHTISQAGYMVVGLGTGLPVGIAGGLFHAFNNAIYKCAISLCEGNVEQKTGTSDLEKLGGLAGSMPWTCAAFCIAGFSTAGIPPLSGFFSKWLIYQGIINLGRTSPCWIIWLVAAMLGSAFTLASFLKLLHAVFLGQRGEATQRGKEAAWQMLIPVLVLSVLAVLFGVFAFTLPLRYLVAPAVEGFSCGGFWQPALATGLLCAGLLAGIFIYKFARIGRSSTKPVFVGGEILPEESTKVSGVDFYDTVKNWSWLKGAYAIAGGVKNGAMDIPEAEK
jgi:formate hydrogenlyase subunit 3/multisubunit Na+/H+ antiporter MnhD subunit